MTLITEQQRDPLYTQGRVGKDRKEFELSNGETRTLSRNQIAFLTAFPLAGTIKAACQACGLSRSSYKRWKAEDREFREAFDDVAADFADQIEEEAIRRAKDGTRTIKFNKDGTPIKDPRKHDPVTGEVKTEWADDPWYYETTFSDRLLELLLRAKKPEEYRERSSVELSGPGGTPVEFDIATQQLAIANPDLAAQMCDALDKLMNQTEQQPMPTMQQAEPFGTPELGDFVDSEQGVRGRSEDG